MKDPSHTASARAGGPSPSRPVWSIEGTLPLLMTGLLAVMLALALVLTHQVLTRSAVEHARVRLTRAADQFQKTLETQTGRIRARVDEAADDPGIGAALAAAPTAEDGEALAARAGSAAAPRRALAQLFPRHDSATTTELWDVDGRRIAFVGQDARAAGTAAPSVPDAQALTVRAGGVTALPAPTDSASIGALYAADGDVFFWVVAPVVRQERHVGYLARQQRIAQPNTDEQIEALLGEDVTGYYHNADGRLWATLSGTLSSAPVARDSGARGLRVTRPAMGDLLAVDAPIAGTPLMLAFEVPERTVLAATQVAVRRLTFISMALLVLGMIAAWLLSRRLTQPLVAITHAAEAVARGDYDARVAASGGDEMARLAHSFNHMAGEVGASRYQLEVQTEEAQAAAEELDRSNLELGNALRSLEEREAQFRALADAIPQLSWMAYADGSAYWYNERWYAYTGAPPGTTGGWSWPGGDDPAVPGEVLERWRRAVATGAPFEMEHPLRGADGGHRWFLTRIQPVRDRDGLVVRWFGTSTDVQTLRDALQTAERLRQQAEAANHAKSQFLTVMSHELRTPLNAIGGYTELLALELRGPITDAQRRDLERIRVSQEYLLGLISGVLDLSRIETGRVNYDLTPVALMPFLAGMDSLVAPQAAAKELTLRHEPCAPQLAAMADREKLRQIVLNLLSNAVRYTPSGGSITLGADSIDSATVRIVVRDTGIGIAREEQESIFEPFVQLDRSLTQGREGVGLGLAISRDLAQGMGGTLTVQSEVGVGSTFTVTLPRTVASPGALAMPSTGDYPSVARGVDTM